MAAKPTLCINPPIKNGISTISIFSNFSAETPNTLLELALKAVSGVGVLNGLRLEKEISVNEFEELFYSAFKKSEAQMMIESESQLEKISESIGNTRKRNFSNLGLFGFERDGVDRKVESFAGQRVIDEKKKRGKRMG